MHSQSTAASKNDKKKESERVQGDGKKSVKLGREKKQTRTSKIK